MEGSHPIPADIRALLDSRRPLIEVDHGGNGFTHIRLTPTLTCTFIVGRLLHGSDDIDSESSPKTSNTTECHDSSMRGLRSGEVEGGHSDHEVTSHRSQYFAQGTPLNQLKLITARTAVQLTDVSEGRHSTAGAEATGSRMCPGCYFLIQEDGPCLTCGYDVTSVQGDCLHPTTTSPASSSNMNQPHYDSIAMPLSQ